MAACCLFLLLIAYQLVPSSPLMSKSIHIQNIRNSKLSLYSKDTTRSPVKDHRKHLEKYQTLMTLITSANTSQNNDTQSYIRSIFDSSHPSKDEAVSLIEICVEHAERKNMFAWSVIMELLQPKEAFSSRLQKVLGTALKSSIVKCAVVLRKHDDLHAIAKVIFTDGKLPNSFSLENTMRLFMEKDPALCLEILQPYITASSPDLITPRSLVPSDKCFSYAITAASFIRSETYVGLYMNELLDSRQDIINLLDIAFRYDRMSVGLVSTALSNCRVSGSWHSTLGVINFVKQRISTRSTKEANQKLCYFEDGKIPDIIYGQALVNYARCGADNSVYQLVCEMLENQASFTDLTINYVFFEIAKSGSYNVLIKIRDLLLRHGVKISDKASNAVLNACDKADAYNEVLAYYFFKMPQSALDYIGLSVLLKACDRSGCAKLASIVVLQAMRLKGIKMKSEIYQRLFAIFLKTNNLNLAIAFLVYLEEIKVGSLNFVGIRVKTNDLSTIVDDWERELLSNGPTVFEKTYFDTVKKYKFLYSSVENLAEQTWNIVEMSDLDFEAELEALVTFKSNPEQFISLYTAVISLLAINQYHKNVAQLLEGFRSRGGTPNIEMFTSAIYSQKFSRNYDKAEELFENLRLSAISTPNPGKAIRLTIAPFNALLAVYSSSNAPLERKRHLFDDIKKLNLSWDVYTYTAAFINEMNKTAVIQLWNQLSTENIVVPSYVSVVKVLNCCLCLKDAETAQSVIHYLWARIQRLSSVTSQPNEYISMRTLMPDANENRIYCLVLMTLHKSGFVDACWNLMSQIRERGFPPTYYMYMIVLRALKEQGDWKRSVTALLQVVLRVKYIHSNLVESVLLTCIKAKEYAVIIKLIEELPKLTKSFEPTAFMLTQYTYAAFKLKDATRARDSLKLMQFYGHMPSSISVAEVISLLELSSDTEAAVDVFESYVAEHLFPKSTEISLVVDLHGYSQVLARAAVRSALRLLKQNQQALEKRKVPPSLILITGIGKNSKEALEPVLKPSIKVFLESFNPPLVADEVIDNPGRLVVPPPNLMEWIRINAREE